MEAHTPTGMFLPGFSPLRVLLCGFSSLLLHGLGRKRVRPFKALSSPRDILFQNPFNFGNGFWMGHQVMTGWNYLLRFGSCQMRAMIVDQSIRAARSRYRSEMSDDAMEGNFDRQISEAVQ